MGLHPFTLLLGVDSKYFEGLSLSLKAKLVYILKILIINCHYRMMCTVCFTEAGKASFVSIKRWGELLVCALVVERCELSSCAKPTPRTNQKKLFCVFLCFDPLSNDRLESFGENRGCRRIKVCLYLSTYRLCLAPPA
jgi:hypothetical protein